MQIHSVSSFLYSFQGCITTLISKTIVWTNHFCSLRSHHISEACSFQGRIWKHELGCVLDMSGTTLMKQPGELLPRNTKPPVFSQSSQSSGFAFLETQKHGTHLSVCFQIQEEGELCYLGVMSDTWINSLFLSFQALPAPLQMWPAVAKNTDTSQGLPLSPFSRAVFFNLAVIWLRDHQRSCKRFYKVVFLIKKITLFSCSNGKICPYSLNTWPKIWTNLFSIVSCICNPIKYICIFPPVTTLRNRKRESFQKENILGVLLPSLDLVAPIESLHAPKVGNTFS